ELMRFHSNEAEEEDIGVLRPDGAIDEELQHEIDEIEETNMRRLSKKKRRELEKKYEMKKSRRGGDVKESDDILEGIETFGKLASKLAKFSQQDADHDGIEEKITIGRRGGREKDSEDEDEEDLPDDLQGLIGADGRIDLDKLDAMHDADDDELDSEEFGAEIEMEDENEKETGKRRTRKKRLGEGKKKKEKRKQERERRERRRPKNK
ncbi:hypothetical protein ADUPG1_000537, partial [Aduncisulcus paluster]